MKKKSLYIFAIFCLYLTSCKKNELPKDDSDNANPEFYFKCDVNGIPINIKAGVDKYYMYSMHSQDTNNVYVYRGDLKQKDCGTTCGYGISIQINDCKESPIGAPMKPDSSLYIGNYQFNDGFLAPLYYSAYFSPLLIGSGATYSWSYSDATSQSTQQGFKTYRTGTTQSAVLSVRQPSPLCSTTHTNSYLIGNGLQTNITAVRDPSLALLKYTFASNVTTSISSSYSYLWEFGDGATSTLSNPTHAYPSQGYYTAKLTLTDASNNVCVSYYQAPCFTYTVCNANYNAYFNEIPNTKALSAITVKVIDPNGVEYSSFQINQSTATKFEIISVENYKPNENGELTKKVKIKFNCSLVSGANTLNINNGEAVIAVSYK